MNINDCIEEINKFAPSTSIEKNESQLYYWKHKGRYKEYTSISDTGDVYQTPEACIAALIVFLSHQLASAEYAFEASQKFIAAQKKKK